MKSLSTLKLSKSTVNNVKKWPGWMLRTRCVNHRRTNTTPAGQDADHNADDLWTVWRFTLRISWNIVGIHDYILNRQKRSHHCHLPATTTATATAAFKLTMKDSTSCPDSLLAPWPWSPLNHKNHSTNQLVKNINQPMNQSTKQRTIKSI